MKESPILFSAPMVRAILAGRKTQTRRVIKGSTEFKGPYNPAYLEAHKHAKGWASICPYGVPGDRLWVREGLDGIFGCDAVYKADGLRLVDALGWEVWDGGHKLRLGDVSPMFMPRWASRITLEVTEVRVERVQDISEADAKAEGPQASRDLADFADSPECIGSNIYRSTFQELWDSINGKRHPWSSNPWVWAITFKVVPC